MTRRVLFIMLLLPIVVMLTGCGGPPPREELQAVKQVLDDARAAGAERFAPREFSEAETAYRQAENEVETEAAKLFKNFTQAREMIADARSKAEAAHSATLTAKQRAREEAEGAIADAANAVDQAQTGLAEAPAGKGTESDIEQLRSDLDQARADLNAARQAVGREEFDTATSSAASAKSTAEQVENGVQMAVERYHELVEAARPWYERI